MMLHFLGASHCMFKTCFGIHGNSFFRQFREYNVVFFFFLRAAVMRSFLVNATSQASVQGSINFCTQLANCVERRHSLEVSNFTYLFGLHKRLMIDDGRICVRHREYCRNSSCQGSCRTRGIVLFLNCSRIARVNMNVDKAGKLDHPSRSHAIGVYLHLRCFATQHAYCL